MKKTALIMLLIGLVASPGLGAPAPVEKNIQIILGGNLLLLADRYSDQSWFLIGPAVLVDLNLGRSVIIAPEFSAGTGGWSAGGTINLRAGKFFGGAGGLVVGGFEHEWGPQVFLKSHIGIRSPRCLLAASFIINRWLTGFGLTAGLTF